MIIQAIKYTIKRSPDMRKLTVVFLACVITIALMSCKGDPGPAGPANNIFCAQFQQSILPSTGYIGANDTYIIESAPDSTNASCTGLTVGGVGGKKSRALLSYTLNTIPSNAIVTAAYLTLSISMYPGSVTLTAYALPDYWFMGNAGCSVVRTNPAYDATWNGPWSTPGGSTATTASNSINVASGTGSPRQVTFVLKNSIVQNWVRLGFTSGADANNGLMIVSNTETTSDYMTFYSGDVTNLPEYRPVLSVYYSLP